MGELAYATGEIVAVEGRSASVRQEDDFRHTLTALSRWPTALTTQLRVRHYRTAPAW